MIFVNQRDPWRGGKQHPTWRFWRWEGRVPTPAPRAVTEQDEEAKDLDSDTDTPGDPDRGLKQNEKSEHVKRA